MARLEAMNYVLSDLDYQPKGETDIDLVPDETIVTVIPTVAYIVLNSYPAFAPQVNDHQQC